MASGLRRMHCLKFYLSGRLFAQASFEEVGPISTGELAGVDFGLLR